MVPYAASEMGFPKRPRVGRRVKTWFTLTLAWSFLVVVVAMLWEAVAYLLREVQDQQARASVWGPALLDELPRQPAHIPENGGRRAVSTWQSDGQARSPHSALHLSLPVVGWIALMSMLLVAWFAAPLQGPRSSLGLPHLAIIAGWLFATAVVFIPRYRRLRAHA